MGLFALHLQPVHVTADPISPSVRTGRSRGGAAPHSSKQHSSLSQQRRTCGRMSTTHPALQFSSVATAHRARGAARCKLTRGHSREQSPISRQVRVQASPRHLQHEGQPALNVVKPRQLQRHNGHRKTM